MGDLSGARGVESIPYTYSAEWAKQEERRIKDNGAYPERKTGGA